MTPGSGSVFQPVVYLRAAAVLGASGLAAGRCDLFVDGLGGSAGDYGSSATLQ